MNIDKLKLIPKYLLARIKKLDKQTYPTQDGHTRYYSYLTKIGSEICKVTVAVRNRYSKWLYKQCAVHGKDSKNCYIKDMNFTYIAGYTVGWNNEIGSKYKQWYERGYFEEVTEDKLFDPYAIPINNEFALKIPKYKYSAIDKYPYEKTIKYLRLYDKYPQIEYFIKMGLSQYAFSVQLLRACKDKAFCKWLFRNKLELIFGYYDVAVILKAYKQKGDLRKLQQVENMAKRFNHDDALKEVRQIYSGELPKLYNYLTENYVNSSSFRDYIVACNYLKLDLNEPKNRYPHDFKRWHDIRIDEYKTARLKADEKQKKEFYDKFLSVANKYIKLQKEKGEFTTIIAKSPNDLIKEGEVLQHCVGSMNYDQKFAREESLIFFIRLSNTPNIPLVTLEYSIEKHKILQCYGKNDSTPNDDILHYVNKVWLPFANRQMKKLQEVA